MNIGQASKASGVSAKMIRYYEQTGLIPKADRKDSGYRDYSPSDVHMLRFIRRARDLGFSVAEINDLLSLWRDTSRQSSARWSTAARAMIDLTARSLPIWKNPAGSRKCRARLRLEQGASDIAPE